MIFQALISLYDRLGERKEVPTYGFSEEDIGFVITIDKQGRLVGQPEDLRKKVNANKYEYRLSIVPYTNHVNVRANAAARIPNFMVDKADYIFGMSGKSKKDEHHSSFKKLIAEVCGDSCDDGIQAARAFLEQWDPGKSAELENWKEISGDKGKWVAFKLQGDSNFIHERTKVKQLWSAFIEKQEYPRGVSFVDGDIHDIQSQYASNSRSNRNILILNNMRKTTFVNLLRLTD